MSRTDHTKPTPAQLKKQERTEAMARWTIDRWDERPSIRYLQMVPEIRRKFECGKTAAEQAIKRAYEMMREEWADKESIADRIAARFFHLSEKAEAKGDLNAAIRALDSLRRHRGVGAPDRVEHSGEVVHDMTGVSEDALLAIYSDIEGARSKPTTGE